MNEIKQPSSQQDNLPTPPDEAMTNDGARPVLRWPRDRRVLPLLMVIAMIIVLRLVLLHTPLARAAEWFWDSEWSQSGGAWWDYPCTIQTCPDLCPPGSGTPTGKHLNGPPPTTPPSGCTGPSCGGPRAGVAMPVWWVSEPILTLWLKDMPLFYQPSRGEPVQFELFLKSQPDQVSQSEMNLPSIFSVGKNWFTPWRSYLRTNDASQCYYFNGRGGLVDFSSTTTDYREHSEFVPANGTNPPAIKYADGSYDVFGWHSDSGDSYNREFRTQHRDREGNITKFNWGILTNANGIEVACLTNIVDVDGKTTSLTYTNIYLDTTYGSTLIYQIVDPCNHTNSLQYDLDPQQLVQPALTNITDSAQMSSSIEYGDDTLPAALHTPYGTTTFSVVVTADTVARAVHVNELGLRDHLYLYEDYDITGHFTNSYAAWRPSTTNSGVFSFANTFDSEASDQRNTFYWGPRQYAWLSADFVSALTNSSTPTVDTSKLYTSNYLHALHRHWLIDPRGKLSQTLSLERDLSPDGVTQGQITWYDYEGKVDGDPKAQGTMNLPLFKAWKLPNGESRFIRYERNSLGWPIREIETYTDGNGNLNVRTNTTTIAANNVDVLCVTNALGVQVMSNVYNAYHQVTTNYNALGEMMIYTYDTSNRLATIRTPAGLTTSNYYGTDGYLAQTVELEIGRTNSYTWSNGSVYSHTDERGLTVTNTWDGLNRLVKTTYPDGTYITNIYSNLDLVQVIDRMGFTQKYDYNDFGQVLYAVDQLGRTNSYDYCTCGLLDSITGPLTNTTSFTYDLAGRRWQTTYADNFTVTYNYDLMGRQTNVWDSAGASTTNCFNNQGLTVAVSNAFGRVLFVQPDILDRTTNQVDANGVAVGSAYDNLDRIITRTCPDNGVEKFVYTANISGPTSYTNQVGNTMLFAYDPAGRKTNEVSVGVSTNRFRYDASGRLTNLIDGKGQTTAWKYDTYGRVTNKLDNLGTNLFSYGYDPNSRLTNRWTPAKGTTAYRYDAVGNLTNIVYPVSSNISLAYDALNRLTSMVDGVGTTAYSYDAVGQILSEDGPWANDTVSYTFNNRLRSGLSVLAPNASPWTQSYGYDAAKRLTNATSPAGTFSYAYDALRSTLPAKLTLPNGAYITNTYDNVARLLSTVLKSSGLSTINSHSYQLNPANQRTQQVFTAGNYVNYAYDGSGQLTAANGKESGGTTNRLHEQLGYTYDPAGNLNYRTNKALVQTFNVNSLNELTTGARSGTMTVEGTTTSPATNVTVNGQTAALYSDATFAKDGFTLVDGTNTFTAIARDSYGRVDTNVSSSYLPASISFTYDSNGNLTNDGRRSFFYDDENQLVSVIVTNGVGSATRSDFAYDGKMRRRIRREYLWQSAMWNLQSEIHYVYDGNLVIQERDASNLPQVSYTRGRDLSGSLEGAGGIGGLLARTDLSTINSSQSTSYYHSDGNGNITCLINASQIVVAKYLYDPYGNILSQSGPLADANLYRFSSKEFHAGSGLVYYLYRFYEPNLQRWLSRDPIEEWGGFNMYRFVENAPVCRHDALGLFTFDNQANLSQDQLAKINRKIVDACNKNFNHFVTSKCPQKMRNCIKNLCQNGIITVAPGRPKAIIQGEMRPLFGSADDNARNVIGKGSHTTIYPNNGSVNTDWGAVAIHEWAHCCGWNHEGEGIDATIAGATM
jgi:RHS repeat-associated protein